MPTYKPEIALGHIITIVIGVLGMFAAYNAFVAETQSSIATIQQATQTNAADIEEIKATLKTVPTQEQIMALQDDVREMKSDIGWLVRREVEKSGH